MKITKLIAGTCCCCIALCCSLMVKGQKSRNISVTRSFSGKIDQYPIEMNLISVIGNDTISGAYYYTKSGNRNAIVLNGILKNNILTIDENTYKVKNDKVVKMVTGHFSLNMDSKWGLNGTWTNAKGDKKLSVNMSCKENNSIYDPSKNKYNSLRYSAKMKTISGGLMDMNKIKGLDIFDDNGTLIHSLKGFDEYQSDSYIDIGLEDFNFDGVMDLKISTYLPERIKNDGSWVYFIYNAAQKKYVRSPALEELEWVEFDAVNQYVLKNDADGSGNESTSSYKWLNNKLYLIKKESVFENDKATYYEEYKIVNGKSVKTKAYKKD